MMHRLGLNTLRSVTQVRFAVQSKAFAQATKSLERTPSGQNAYDVLDISLTKTTSADDISKQFKAMAVKYHPDREGGSHERMSEINAAYKILKENHTAMLKNLTEAEQNMKANSSYREHQRNRKREVHKDIGRSGGLQSRGNVRNINNESRKRRSAKEIESEFEVYRTDVEEKVQRMSQRYDYAIEVGSFFRKTATMTEITVRERWLRKTFLKGMWEDIHELRAELLKSGSRNVNVSQLAEEMVSFASTMQNKLNDDFDRLTQRSVQEMSRVFLMKFAALLSAVLIFLWSMAQFLNILPRFSLTVQLREGMQGY